MEGVVIARSSRFVCGPLVGRSAVPRVVGIRPDIGKVTPDRHSPTAHSGGRRASRIIFSIFLSSGGGRGRFADRNADDSCEPTGTP
jgi:hypothetical protein